MKEINTIYKKINSTCLQFARLECMFIVYIKEKMYGIYNI